MAHHTHDGILRKASGNGHVSSLQLHFPVALDYEKDRTPLPVILAKGQGVLAQRMIETAREEGIPIMRNVPLARSLYEQGTENAYIPQDLIGPVAEVLRWVQSLRQG